MAVRPEEALKAAELLSPAGNFETALAAFDAGADAVYCGLSEFSARAFADNFSYDELKSLLRVARVRGKKVFVTFNTVIDEGSLEAAVERLARLDELGPDALIVQDIGVARICRRHFPALELHASTQLVAHNLEGVLALKEMGFRRVVLARELSLDEIVSIARRCGGLELEVFVHGALCYSVSGLCLFGAMEKGRSGNRGKCPYCCRLPYADAEGRKRFPFSMKDLRLGEDVRRLVEAGVASLKIEGRMKSALYVASVTRYYRQILGTREAESGPRRPVSVADLETVFSRRTTELYFHGGEASPGARSPIDPSSLGHLGAEIGVVKRITKDREGLSWLRFHTARGLEKHDGLQFEAMVDGKHVGLGVVEMRQAISRRPVFEVAAGEDVEVLLPTPREGAGLPDLAEMLKPGMKVYCSMSNAVKRMFPTPGFRPSDFEGAFSVDVEVSLERTSLSARVTGPAFLAASPDAPAVSVPCELPSAQHPERTVEGVRKALSKLGETDYRLGALTVNDPDRLLAPMSVLNDARRDLVARLDAWREQARRAKVDAALADAATSPAAVADASVRTSLKVCAGQDAPPGSWDEIVVAISAETREAAVAVTASRPPKDVRLALPVYTAEPQFNRLRSAVKRFLRAGYEKWEASDLATLRMLKALGVTDVTGDWTLYAFNAMALAELAELGVKRFVASPENGRENQRRLVESGYAVAFLSQQSTPLFVSLTEPAARPAEFAVFRRGGLWVTTRPAPRTFDVPPNAPTRLDLSWDPA